MRMNSNMKKFANAFMNPSGVMMDQTVVSQPDEVMDLEEMIQEMSKLTADEWGMYAFSREPLERKFSLNQKLEYIKNAMLCGIQEAEHIKSMYGIQDPLHLTKSLGITVQTPDIPNGGGNVVFAQFVEPGTITIYMDTIKKANPYLSDEKIKQIIGGADAFEVLLAHELFHWVEYSSGRQLYTQTEKVELWRKPFSNKSKIICLGEIAGMAFAKELLDLSIHPYIFDVLFMYGYNKAAATALYQDIMEIKKELETLEADLV